MKTFVICVLALGGLAGFSGCESMEEHHNTTTTTTEETTVRHPGSAGVETQTVRTY